MNIRKFKNLWGPSLAALAALLPSWGQAQTATNVRELLRLADAYGRKAKAEKREAERRAKLAGLPMRTVDPQTKQVAELMRFLGNTPIYYRTLNLEAAKSVGTDRVWPGGDLGLELSGVGVVLGVWDGGQARRTHQELAGRVTSPDGGSAIDHATHVAGTMIAAGVVPQAKGMSFQADLRSYDWNLDTMEMASEAANGLLLSNHSYGSWGPDWAYGAYLSPSDEFDNIAYNAPFYLIVQAAGNSQGSMPGGWDTLIIPASAKNVLTVGAVQKLPGGYSGPESVKMSDFSSWGPTDDGRIKPDIVTPGVDLYSSLSGSDTDYGYSSGTSMAAPTAAGSLGLVTQMWALTHDGGKMRSATLKALAIHTADEAGPALGPDYKFGWGLLNTASMCSLILDSVSAPDMIQETSLGGGNPDTYEYEVDVDGQSDLKVTIVWTDPPHPAMPGGVMNDRTPMLINDLDLRVENDGKVYEPWVLNVEQPSEAATTGDNSVDNVEQVVFRPVAGKAKIKVSAKNSLQPSGSQAFSIIITGAKAAELVSFDVNPKMIYGGNRLTGTLELNRRAPSGGLVVQITSSHPKVVPSSQVRIRSGLQKMEFQIATRTVQNPVEVTLTAKYGTTTLSSTFWVNPRGIRDFYFEPSTVPGGQIAKGHVVMGQAAPAGGATVTIAASNRSLVAFEWKVTVPEGEIEASFDVETQEVKSVQEVRFWAAHPGPTRSATLRIVPSTEVDSVSLNPSRILGGLSVTGTVRLKNPANAGGQVVNLESSDTSVATVPASVTVPEGSVSATFSVATTAVDSRKNATITASTPQRSAQAVLAVLPEGILEIRVPETLVGGTTGTGTVHLTGPAGSGGATVELSSSSSLVSVPATVLVPQGQSSAEFSVSAPVVPSSAQTVTVTAKLGSTSESANVRVAPAAMWLTATPGVLTSNATGTVTLNLAAAPAVNTVVRLRSSNSKLRVPSSVTIPAGATSVTFTVRATRLTRTESAVIRATGAGRTASVTIQLAP
ncbi:MAG: S8 family serine peptidase [Fimbriimonadales bacterium]|nr:S8 family serine peptidase [Fimbriimonadales bacterium]